MCLQVGVVLRMKESQKYEDKGMWLPFQIGGRVELFEKRTFEQEYEKWAMQLPERTF